MKWQLIETAPKDGTVILGARYDKYCGNNGAWIMASVEWLIDDYNGAAYWSLLAQGAHAVHGEWEPTHWALPEPPL